jgi:predicted PhzF superfamily epimerase YddE/YHI9
VERWLWSEKAATTFVLPTADPGHTAHVRIFTPVSPQALVRHAEASSARAAKCLGLAGVLIAVNSVDITFAMVSNTAEVATPRGKTPPLQPLLAR